MKLIFALGNPGDQYTRTRHNVGFQILDRLANEHGAAWTTDTKFKSMTAKIIVGNQKLLLAKPTTYYNEAGDAFHRLQSYYGVVPTDILIIHDELAIPFGTVRTRIGGSDGGNKGIRSLLAHSEADSAMRIRIGIANELSEKIDASDFVLSKFTKGETETLDAIYAYSIDAVHAFTNDALEPTTYQV